MAYRVGCCAKKLLKAAARAAKNKGPLPPQLWKKRIAGNPTWAEFDRASYRELATMIALENVYLAVDAWAHGRADGELMKYYSQLVGMGIVGKDVK